MDTGPYRGIHDVAQYGTVHGTAIIHSTHMTQAGTAVYGSPIGNLRSN